MVGIYKITNKINGKVYIGQSLCIENRIKEHIRNINYPDRKNAIYSAFRKYGIENFSFDVIEECKEEDLDNREKYWIKYYDSYNNGYNLTLGGENGRKYDYDYIVEQYKIYKTTEKTAEAIGCHYHTVSNALKAQNITPYAKSSGLPRKIKQIDPVTLKVVAEYEKIKDGAEAVGVSDCAISNVLRGLKKAAGGYIWKYSEDKTELKSVEIKNMHRNQKLQQLDKNTEEVIMEYNSVKEALIALNKNVKDGSIYQVCKGKANTAYGYKWRFIDS